MVVVTIVVAIGVAAISGATSPKLAIGGSGIWAAVTGALYRARSQKKEGD